jgi:tight adherence protein B
VKRSRLGIERQAFSPGKSVDDLLERHGKRGGVAHALNLAAVTTEPGTFVLWVFLGSLVAALVALSVVGPLVALIVFVVVPLLARTVVRIKGRKRQERFAAQLPDVLQLLISALRSGFSLPQALEAVAQEADEPARSEFERVLAETRVGQDLAVAMKTTAQRMGCADLEWVASAVDINRETGGNLAEVLENVTATIRGRYRLRRQIRTLTAEGRVSMKVLTGLPLTIFIFRTLADEQFRAVMFQGLGLVALGYGAVSLTLGWIIVRRIITVKGV